MKKTLGTVLVSLALLIPSSYYATGFLSKRIITNNLGALNQSNMVSVSIKKYQQGWFQSEIDMHLIISRPQEDLKNAVYELDIPVKLNHGPIYLENNKIYFGLAGANIVAQLPKEVQQNFYTVFSKESIKPVIKFKINVNYLGKCHFSTNVPKFYLNKLDNSAALEWLGMKNDVTASASLSQVHGNFDLYGFEFKKPATQVLLRSIHGTYNLSKSPNGLFLGLANLNIQSALSKSADSILLSLNNLKIESSTGVNSGLFYSDFCLKFASMIFDDNNIEQGLIKINIKNLNEAMLAKINKKLDMIQTAKTDDEKQQIVFSLLPDLPTLLGQGAELTIPRFSMNLSDGALSGNLNIKIPHATNLNWFEIMQKTTGQMYIRIPRVSLIKLFDMARDPKAADSSQDKINALVKAGGLITEQDHFVLKIELAQGSILVNGKTASPELLKLF